MRALAGLPFTGFDVVEVSPPYDGPGQTTALHASAIAYEMLALLAVARRGSS
jgi:agmatinase